MPVTERPILLTGATGFVGMAVLARLLRAGHEVICLVRAADDAEADARAARRRWRACRRPPGPAPSPSPAISTAPRLGLGERHAELAARVGTSSTARRRWPSTCRSRSRARSTSRARGACSTSPARCRACSASSTCRPPTSPATGAARSPRTTADRRVPQRLRALQARGRGARAREQRCRPRSCGRASSWASAPPAGPRRSTSSTCRCARSRAARSRCCPARRRSPVDVVGSTTSPTRSPRWPCTPTPPGRRCTSRRASRRRRVGEVVQLATRRFDAAPPRLVRRTPTARAASARPAPARRPARRRLLGAARSTSRISRCASASTTPARGRCWSRWGSRPRRWTTTSGG